MAIYITKDGDMLDAICLSYYGRQKGVTEAVLDHNPRLADLGDVYPLGTAIELPDLPQLEEKEHTIRLWD